MRRAALAAGRTDLLIVNSCAVTAEAVRQTRQAIRRAKRENPKTSIIVTGCAAEIDPSLFTVMPEVFQVLGNSAKANPTAWLTAGKDSDTSLLPRDPAPPPVLNEGLEDHTRAFLAVQTGCDHRCTFCIIPFGRGPSRSVPMDQILAAASRLTDKGFKEIVLTGVDLTSYGADLPEKPRLGTLVKAILCKARGLARLRLSSIDCIEADADLLSAFAEEPRLMPYLHLSLQSGDDLILKRMKRRHLRAEAVRFCANLRRLRPNIVFGADLIAGFPTESDAMFQNSLALIKDCGLTHLHVFPFSARPGTPAARMPQVATQTIKQRASRLREAGMTALRVHLEAQKGKRLCVLSERDGTGRSEDFTQVRLGPVSASRLMEVEIAGHNGTMLEVRPAI